MSIYKPVSSVLSASGSNLESLLERAQYLKNLTLLLRANIDPAISTHIVVANLRGDTAIVAADSPAWLSKIRYLAPVILQLLKLEPGLDSLNKIQFRVLPTNNPQAQTHEPRKVNLSAVSSEVLESAASGIHDPELADALRRLSRRGSPHSD
jgi:hypothetical protein